MSLKARTIRYYSFFTEPILLIVADISVDIEEPNNCPLYYLWIHEKLEEMSKEELPLEQQTVTLRIPRGNTLTRKTDIQGVLSNFKASAEAGRLLNEAVRNGTPELSAAEQSAMTINVAKGIGTKSPALLSALAQTSDGMWVEAPKGSLPWHLKLAQQQIDQGLAEEAERNLTHALALYPNASTLEKAEYWLQKGRLEVFQLNDPDGAASFERAVELGGSVARFLTPWAETIMRVRAPGERRPVDLTDIISRLTTTEDSVLAMKARLLLAEGRREEAKALASTIAGEEGRVVEALISFTSDCFSEAIQTCDQTLALTTLQPGNRILLTMFRARSKFHLAIGPTPDDRDFRLPISGPVGANIPLLLEAWGDLTDVADMLERRGWPPATSLVVDVWSSIASMLGRPKEILGRLKVICSNRPQLREAWSALETLAAHCGEYDVALDANSKLPQTDIMNQLRRVSLLHFAHRDRDCADLFAHLRGKFPEGHPAFVDTACMAIESADRIARTADVLEWSRQLDNHPEWAVKSAVRSYNMAVARSPLAKDGLLATLEQKYDELGQPAEIAALLFHELDAAVPEAAAKCIDLAVVMSTRRLMPLIGTYHLAQALVTVGRWQELLELTRKAKLQFSEEDRLVAIEATALDRLGRTAEAHALLSQMIGQQRADSFALSAYLNIAIRSGFHEEAIRALEDIYSSEADQEKRIGCLLSMFNLRRMQNLSWEACVEIAWRIGQIVDQNDVEQEGIYVAAMLQATTYKNVVLSEVQGNDFRRRLAAYSNSTDRQRKIRMISFPENASADQIFQAIGEATGYDEAAHRSRQAIRNKLRRGEVPVPFVFRPRIIDGVGDLPSLWELGKVSRPEEKELHLHMAQLGWQAVPAGSLRQCTPLLDMVALLVIHDLDIFDELFRIFNRIAVAQGTLLELANYLLPFSGSVYAEKCREIQGMLGRRFSDIDQPRASSLNNDNTIISIAAEEIQVLSGGDQYVTYSDDYVFRVYCSGGKPDRVGVSTLDVLYALAELGMCSPSQVAQKIALLCSWNVGVVVTNEFLVAILPDQLRLANDIDGGIAAMRSDWHCRTLYEAIWSLEKKMDSMVVHAAGLLRELCDQQSNRFESIVGVMGFWLSRVRLHKESIHGAKLIANLVVLAAAQRENIDVGVSKRLWDVLLKLVEYLHGNRMDTAKERQAIVFAARIAKEFDSVPERNGMVSLHDRLRFGLVDGSSQYSLFLDEYARHSIARTLAIR
jgi:tetratricopeptide (TPR) repeat protein